MKIMTYLLAFGAIVTAMAWSCGQQRHGETVRDEDEVALNAAIEAGERELDAHMQPLPMR